MLAPVQRDAELVLRDGAKQAKAAHQWKDLLSPDPHLTGDRAVTARCSVAITLAKGKRRTHAAAMRWTRKPLWWRHLDKTNGPGGTQ